MTLLTIHDLKPGHHYRVVDPGDADPFFQDAIVLAVRPIDGRRAVTVWTTTVDNDWAGAAWYGEGDDEDRDARFEEVEWPAPVWVVNETSAEYGNESPLLFAKREDAVAAAQEAILAYASFPLVSDEVREVLAEFNNQADCGGDCGAGDGGALFYVDVFKTRIRQPSTVKEKA